MAHIYNEILKRYWGHDTFRPMQLEIIESIASGYDTFGLMPTGGGKSITFQVPALTKEGICIVITPLIALMRDQVQNLKARGIRAAAVYSSMSRAEIANIYDNCEYGDFKFLYISPERVANELFQKRISYFDVSMIVVDECHCISQWGYDFRPSYLNIVKLREMFPDAPCLALTATATNDVIKDIQRVLHFKPNHKFFKTSFVRPNLTYVVREVGDKIEEMTHILDKVSGSSVVYARNRKKCEEVAEILRNRGYSAEHFHALIEQKSKNKTQKSWMTDKVRIVVATNAFGMGIDKPDVRTVIHLDLPDSVEAYFQEAGRAGRDGRNSYAIVLYSPNDSATLKRKVTETFPDREYIKEVYQNLANYFVLAANSGDGAVYAFDLDHFCSRYRYQTGKTFSALKLLELSGYLELTDEIENPSKLMITIRREDLYNHDLFNKNEREIIDVLLRSYTGLFADMQHISEKNLSERVGISRDEIYKQLLNLNNKRVVKYIPYAKTPFLVYSRERVPSENLRIPKEVYEDRQKRAIERISVMINYVTQTNICRGTLLIRYFGEDNNRPCGKCDVCLANRSTIKNVEQRILESMVFAPKTVREISNELEITPEQVLDNLRKLMDRGRVSSSGIGVEQRFYINL